MKLTTSLAILILRWRRRLAAARIHAARAYAAQQRDSADYTERHLIPHLESEAARINGRLFAAEYPVKPQWGGSTVPERWVQR